MARANHHVVLGQIWHITHRCHKWQWLLKFARDRRRWMYWLFEARRRYGLVVLNYMVTSNPIHLLVRGQKKTRTPTNYSTRNQFNQRFR